MSAVPITHVVKNGKRHSKPEVFDPDKLQKSLTAACLASGVPTGHAESIAHRATEQVVLWLQSRPEVTSGDLRRVAAKHLRTYHPDAGYLYEHHRSTL